MHELALYRKYRPKTFDEVVGQEHVVEALEKSVKAKKVSHAYLFVGSRGTGKTTVARIFAAEIGVTVNDLYEIDAASNRGIDDIKLIREGVRVLPFDSKYKVYIIDEVHMLSKDAWGALLKTLEEPPEHVIFILATTELDRVPETIISRCQVFQFKKPSHEVLKKLVQDVAKKEGASLEPTGAELVALMGEGSFRDALSILQKVLTVSRDKKLTEAEVGKVVGAPSSKTVHDFLHALADKNTEKAIGAFHEAVTNGSEPRVFLLLAITKVRGVLLMRYAPKLEKELAEQFGGDDLAILKELAGAKGAAINSSVLAELLTAYIETSRAPYPAIPLELALYRLNS